MSRMKDLERLFEPIATDTVSEVVVEQIEQLIVSGVLKSETKLPAERELAELLQASRPKVRDALKELEQRGLVVARHGDGTFVAKQTGSALAPAMVELFARHPKAFVDYLEFRREIEGYAAFTAAQRASDTDREIIRRLLDEMEDAHKEADPTHEAAVDVALHTAIADATHNAMVSHVLASIYDLMSRGVFYNRDFLYREHAARDQLLTQHQAIANGVLAGDAEGACAAAEAHLDFVKTAFDVSAENERRDKIARKRLMLLDQRQALTRSRPRSK